MHCTATAQVWCLLCRSFTKHGQATLVACVHCKTLDSTPWTVSMAVQELLAGGTSTGNHTAVYLQEDGGMEVP